MYELADLLFGLHMEKPDIHHMAARAVFAFFISLMFVRIGSIRLLGKHTAFDSLTLLMMGAIMARAIVTDQSFPGSILASLIIVVLHRFVSWITFKSRIAGKILKGKPLLLIENGEMKTKNLSKAYITEEDIMSALRQQANINSLEKVKAVYLERSGKISVIKKESEEIYEKT